ncbi:MAG: hypothetical protein AAF560_29445, partial [Acidobacteriota bacterium]
MLTRYLGLIAGLFFAGLLLATLPFAGSVQAEQRPAWFLETEGGHIDGRRALVAYPAVDGSPVDPAGFTVHLDPFDGSSQRLAVPAGEWFTAPAGLYRVWLEGYAADGSPLISGSSKVLSWTDQENTRGMAIGIPVSAAAQIRVEAEAFPDDAMLSAIRADDHVTEGGNPGEEILRVMTLSEARAGFTMPPGKVQVRLVDRAGGASRALSQPVEASAGDETVLRLTPLGPDEAGLVLIVKRPAGKRAQSIDDFDAVPRVESATGTIEPDAVSERRSLILATWTSLPPGPAIVQTRSEATGLDLSREITLE